MGLGKEKEETPLEYQIRICENRDQLGLTWDDVAKVLNDELDTNFGESKYRKWWYAFEEGMNYVNLLQNEKNNLVQEFCENQKKDFQITKNGEQTSTILCKLNSEQLKDTDYILKLHGYDPNVWQITTARQSIWNNSVDNELYSSKISVKPRKDFNWNEENLKKLFRNINNYDFQKDKFKFTTKNIDLNNKNKNTMLLITVADLHYGLLAKDNISEEYNMKIAEERFNNIIEDIISRKCLDSTIEKVVLLVGNDFLSADNVQRYNI